MSFANIAIGRREASFRCDMIPKTPLLHCPHNSWLKTLTFIQAAWKGQLILVWLLKPMIWVLPLVQLINMSTNRGKCKFWWTSWNPRSMIGFLAEFIHEPDDEDGGRAVLWQRLYIRPPAQQGHPTHALFDKTDNNYLLFKAIYHLQLFTIDNYLLGQGSQPSLTKLTRKLFRICSPTVTCHQLFFSSIEGGTWNIDFTMINRWALREKNVFESL